MMSQTAHNGHSRRRWARTTAMAAAVPSDGRVFSGGHARLLLIGDVEMPKRCPGGGYSEQRGTRWQQHHSAQQRLSS